MLTLGTILQNRYQVIALLGQGGMGAVYLALHLGLNQYVAVKENFSADPAATAQFQTEAAILARLSHPNLPRVTDFFVEPNGTRYLVMDYVEGQNLEEIVQHRGALAEKDALAWMAQIFDAVKYLHANRIIHRDIKPQNIIIAPQGKAVLVDFGIAKIHITGATTQTGARALGSPGFAPPEQYGGGTDERSDIYSLGATLYFALTGQPPQVAPLRAAGTPLTPPQHINNAVSSNTEQVILRAMNLDVNQRFRSVHLATEALYAIGTSKANRFPPQPYAGLVLLGMLLAIVVLFFASSNNGLFSAALVPFGMVSPTHTRTTTSTATPTLIATRTPIPTVTPTRTNTDTQTPLPTRTNTDTRTPLPTSTPTITPTPTDAPTPILVSQPVAMFKDDFDGPNLDMGKWILDSISSSVAVGGGTLQTASSQSRYPYIYTRNNPFPTNGDFRMNFRFRYPDVRTCGVGIMISSVLVPAGLSQDETARRMQEAEWNGVTAGVWQDNQQGLVIWFRSGNDRADRPYGGIDRGWHEITVEYSGSRYEIDLDGGRAYTSSTTPYRPRYIWIGHPADLRVQCSWDSLEVDYIHVEVLR